MGDRINADIEERKKLAIEEISLKDGLISFEINRAITDETHPPLATSVTTITIVRELPEDSSEAHTVRRLAGSRDRADALIRRYTRKD